VDLSSFINVFKICLAWYEYTVIRVIRFLRCFSGMGMNFSLSVSVLMISSVSCFFISGVMSTKCTELGLKLCDIVLYLKFLKL
jgi:hypothetical protein